MGLLSESSSRREIGGNPEAESSAGPSARSLAQKSTAGGGGADDINDNSNLSTFDRSLCELYMRLRSDTKLNSSIEEGDREGWGTHVFVVVVVVVRTQGTNVGPFSLRCTILLPPARAHTT